MAQQDEMCFENLDEYVNDENKLVTYKWLSRTLSMHVNLAKQALYSFVEKQRNEKDNDSLSVTYLLAGICSENGHAGTYKVQIVPEESLESSKSTFSVLTSCHVYSVMKGKLKDPSAVYSADYDTVKANLFSSNEYSAVTCPKAVLRSEEESSLVSLTKPADKGPVVENGSTTSAKSKPVPVSKDKKKQPAGIAGMFAKSSDKTKTHQADTAKENTEAKEAPKPQKGKAKPSGGVMSFFNKQATKPSEETAKDIVKKEEIKEEPAKVKEPSPVKSKATEDEGKKSTKSPVKSTNKGKKKAASSDDEESGQSKKRRRVRQQIESSESEEEMETESPIPSPARPEPEPEPSPEREDPIPSPVSSPAKRPAAEDNEMCGKVKKRKLVSKTFVNDEGFMVTEKVWEDQWEDAPVPEKPTPKPADTKKTETKKTETKTKSNTSPTRKKKASPNKTTGKQTSLMSFFKKN